MAVHTVSTVAGIQDAMKDTDDQCQINIVPGEYDAPEKAFPVKRGNLIIAGVDPLSRPWLRGVGDMFYNRNSPVDEVAFHNLRISHCQHAVVFDARSAPMDNIGIYDCVFHNIDVGGNDDAALFCKGVPSITIARSLFRNMGQDVSGRDHPFYLTNDCGRAEIYANLFINCQDGGQPRCDVGYWRNVVIDCVLGLDTYGGTNIVRDTEQHIFENYISGVARWGLRLMQATGGVVKNNLVSHPNPSFSSTYAVCAEGDLSKLTFADNIAQGFTQGMALMKAGFVPRVSKDEFSDEWYANWGQPGYTAADILRRVGVLSASPSEPPAEPAPEPVPDHAAYQKRIAELEAEAIRLHGIIDDRQEEAVTASLRLGDALNRVRDIRDAANRILGE